MSSNITNLNEQNFAQTIQNSDGTVLVDFWAEWCQPCHMLAPTLDEIAGEHSDATVAKVNIDDSQQLAAEYGITSIPTVLVFNGGEVRDRIVGVQPKSAYANAISANSSAA